MKDLYQTSQHASFQEASAEAKAISGQNDFAAVVRRSRTDPEFWDVLVPQPIEKLQDGLEDDSDSVDDEDQELYDAALRDLQSEEELWNEEQDWIANREIREIREDIYSDQEDWGRLDDEGWFYED